MNTRNPRNFFARNAYQPFPSRPRVRFQYPITPRSTGAVKAKTLPLRPRYWRAARPPRDSSTRRGSTPRRPTSATRPANHRRPRTWRDRTDLALVRAPGRSRSRLRPGRSRTPCVRRARGWRMRNPRVPHPTSSTVRPLRPASSNALSSAAVLRRSLASSPASRCLCPLVEAQFGMSSSGMPQFRGSQPTSRIPYWIEGPIHLERAEPDANYPAKG